MNYLAGAHEERTVYFISDDDAVNIDRWIQKIHSVLFENELEGWYTDERLWPIKRDLNTFEEWFEEECHALDMDTVGGQIIDNET